MASIEVRIDIALPTVTEEKTVKRSWHLAKHFVSADGQTASFVAGQSAGEGDLRAVLAAMEPAARERVIGRYLEEARRQVEVERYKAFCRVGQDLDAEKRRRAEAELEIQRLTKALDLVRLETTAALNSPERLRHPDPDISDIYFECDTRGMPRRRGQFW